MKSGNTLKILAVVVLLGIAAFGFSRFFFRDSGVSEETFFYDLSEKKLFPAPREALPPTRGRDGKEEDAVRAVVISRSGNPADKSTRTIAYLEKYAPELKKSIEDVRQGKGEALPNSVRNSLRFVKRVEDADWHRVDTPEGQEILNGWNVAGPDGKFPAVCVP